jgi:hypothetical protein
MNKLLSYQATNLEKALVVLSPAIEIFLLRSPLADASDPVDDGKEASPATLAITGGGRGVLSLIHRKSDMSYKRMRDYHKKGTKTKKNKRKVGQN